MEAYVRRTYAYSEEVVETETCLKDLRAAERAHGTATVETATGYVRVTRSLTEAADRGRADAAQAFHRAA